MQFFFPDSQDQVNPLFDMITEEHVPHRVRQRDDRYALVPLEPHLERRYDRAERSVALVQ